MPYARLSAVAAWLPVAMLVLVAAQAAAEEPAREPAKEPEISLPVADQAAAGKAAPETTLTVPRAWSDDAKGCEAKIDAALAAITVKLTKKGETYEERLTIAVDRGATYRTLYTAWSKAVETGFTKIQFACLAGEKEKEKEVRYLPMDPPTTFAGPKGILYFRILRDGDKVKYFLGGVRPREFASLADVLALLKTLKVDADRALVIWPEPDISVQAVIDALNVGTAAGFQRFSLKAIPAD